MERIKRIKKIMDKQKVKHILASKTIWMAVLQGLAGLLLALTTTEPALKDVAGFMLAKSALDLIIRAMTTKPLDL